MFLSNREILSGVRHDAFPACKFRGKTVEYNDYSDWLLVKDNLFWAISLGSALMAGISIELSSASLLLKLSESNQSILYLSI